MQPNEPDTMHVFRREAELLLVPDWLLLGDFDPICPGSAQRLLRPRAPLLGRVEQVSWRPAVAAAAAEAVGPSERNMLDGPTTIAAARLVLLRPSPEHK